MNVEQIIFNILNKSAHTWVRYWKTERNFRLNDAWRIR